MKVTRRDVLKAGAAAGAGLVAASTPASKDYSMANQAKFTLKYAPHFGMFRSSAGDDAVDQIKFAADEGFHAWEENGMKGFSTADQERISKAMAQNGVTMGIFVGADVDWSNPTLTTGGKEHVDKFVAQCKESVDVAKRMNAKWMTIVPGLEDPRQEPAYQTAHVVEALRRACEVFEPHGLVMVIEPLNYRDHPHMFLTRLAQGFEMCRAVGSSSCKVLDDLYHQQIEVGNLIPNIDAAWSEIGYFQIGDNPGRNEPLTGEVDYRAVFGHIAGKGYAGVLGMEHGNSIGGKEGERRLINAYRWCDGYATAVLAASS